MKRRRGNAGHMHGSPPELGPSRSLARSLPGLRLISGDNTAVDPSPSPLSLLPVSPLYVPPLPSLPISAPFSSSLSPHSLPHRPIIIHPAIVWQGSWVGVCVCVSPGASLRPQQRSSARTHRGLCPCLTPWKYGVCV